MRLRICMWIFILAGVIFVATIPLQGHHSIAGFWAVDKDMSVTGVVTEVKLVNPHPSLRVEVMEAGQKVEYVAILRAGVIGLSRMGYDKRTFAPGTKITLDGHPPKAASGGKGIFVEAFTLADGKKVKLSEQ